MLKILFGLSVAIETPFDKKDKIELNELRNHISYLISYNIKSFTFFGTTGEGPSISLKEKIKSRFKQAACRCVSPNMTTYPG